jgi:hypothetical protein
MFTIYKAGMDIKNVATTDIFTVPTSRTFVATGTAILVTAVTGAGAGTERWAIKESSASRAMIDNAASSSTTPVANQTFYHSVPTAASGPYSTCTAGNKAQFVPVASQAGSTAVTGTVFVTGYYTS